MEVSKVEILSGIKMSKVANVHPLKVNLNDKGVIGYFQPVDDRLQDAFSQCLSVEIVRLVNDGDIENSQADEVLWLSVVYIVIELTNIFYHRALIEKSQSVGVQVTRNFDGTDTLGKYRDVKDILTHLGGRHVHSLPTHTQLRAMLRWGWGYFRKRDGFSRVPPSFMAKSSDVLCFSGDEALVKQVRANGKRLVLGALEQWFGGLTYSAESPRSAKFKRYAADICNVSHQLAKDAGLVVFDVTEIVEAAIFEILSLVDNYLSHVSRKSKLLPQELWLGSGGNLFNRTIARVAQKSGAKVVSLDHGSGSGWLALPLVRLINVDFCDAYLTFAEGQAIGIEEISRPELTVKKAVRPQIEVSTFPLFSKPKLRGTHCSGRRPRVMYVPSIYENGMTIIPPLIAEMPALDFQVKLLCSLRDLGYEVVLKPHPECRVGVPKALLDVTGATLETRRFEEVCSESDILVFDYLSTSAIRSAFFTDTALVLINHGRVPVLPKAKELLEKRAAFLNVERDEKNRTILDVNLLETAIGLASRRKYDRGFLGKYFSHE